MSISESEYIASKAGNKTYQVDMELDKLANYTNRLHKASEELQARLNRVCRPYVTPNADKPQGETPYVQLAGQLNDLGKSAYQTLQILEIILETLEI